MFCGWSHNIAKGITCNGCFVFVGWGRCDMGQLPRCSSSTSQERSIPYPTLLPPPPPMSKLPVSPQREIKEVWCGSEFTVASDAEGFLWGCGWSEHGNLSCGSGGVLSTSTESTSPTHVRFWTAVVRAAPVVLSPFTSPASSYSCSPSACLGTYIDVNLEGGGAWVGQQQMQLADVWEGALSCGGAHCLTFAVM